MTADPSSPRTESERPVPAWRLTTARLVLFWEQLWPALLPVLLPIAGLAVIGLFDGWRYIGPSAHFGVLGIVGVVLLVALFRLFRCAAWPTRDAAIARLETDSALAHAPIEALSDRPFQNPVEARAKVAKTESTPATSDRDGGAGEDGELDENSVSSAVADGNGTAFQRALWERHRERMAAAARTARVKGAHATADRRDPLALRYLTIGLLVLGFVAAGPEWKMRLAGTFDPLMQRSTVATRADIWIDPPAYTGAAPQYLMRAGERLPADADEVNVPAGARVTALINGSRGAALTFLTDTGTLVDAVEPQAGAAESDPRGEDGGPTSWATSQVPTTGEADQSGSERRQLRVGSERRDGARRLSLTVDQSGTLTLKLRGQSGAWPISVRRDNAPVVRFIENPAVDDQRRIVLSYVFDDDYGAKSAEFVFRLDPDQERPLDAPSLDGSALATERRISLEGGEGPSGERNHTISLEDEPWAGLSVIARIVITDSAGQTGSTEERMLRLPQRAFFNPLAKSVIEQRQALAVASNQIQRVRDALSGLTLIPEKFYEDTSEYLLMTTAFWRVQRNQDDDYTDVVDHFWPLALELEDQALELARRRLEAAMEALRQALENNAGETVVNQRREDVEQAIKDFIQALAQSGAVEDGAGGTGGGDQLGKSDIEEMLDQIENLSSSGANNAARQLLSDLEAVLENLRLTRGGGGGSGDDFSVPGEGQGESQSSRAGELIGKQRDLSNRSFERGQQQDGAAGDQPNGQGGQGQSPENNNRPDGEDLAQEQGDLAEEVRELLEELMSAGDGQQDGRQGNTGQQDGSAGKGSGTADGTPGAGRGGEGNRPDPDGSASAVLEDAIREMRRSEDALERGDFGRAQGAMDRAIAKLREGAQALARARAARQGEEGRGGDSAGDQGQDGRDPLGRSTTGTGGGDVKVPDQPDPARTRDVIEELRRRLGEQGRSEEEIEYLERLLNAF